MERLAPREAYSQSAERRICAGVLLTDALGRVLLLEPAYQREWEAPGGLAEIGESPRQAARRHLREMLDLDRPVGSLLVIDWVPPEPSAGDALVLVYDGGTLDEGDAARLRLASRDLNAYGFAELEGVAGLISENLKQRLLAALRGRRTGRVIEMADGRPEIARDAVADW